VLLSFCLSFHSLCLRFACFGINSADADDDGGAAALERFQKIVKKVERALAITRFLMENQKEAWDMNFGELPWETYWERFARVSPFSFQLYFKHVSNIFQRTQQSFNHISSKYI
jgi:hypothetical protein